MDRNEAFLANFLALAAIPRPSRQEEQASRYLWERALAKGLDARRDEAGNVIVDKPAHPGFEGAPLTILQAHMDMVAVGRPGHSYDASRDPVTVVNDGTALRALHSSLGGDDGAGVALIQALLEDDTLPCGPLRGIFTTNEENGMTGAAALDPAELAGQYLLNLDWMQSGSLCCAAAGAMLCRFTFSHSWEEARGEAVRLRLSGLLGGHSGTMIHMGHVNALWALASLLGEARSAGLPLCLASLEGGGAHNVISVAAEAVAVVPESRAEAFRSFFRDWTERFHARYGAVESGARWELEEAALPQHALSEAATAALLDFFNSAALGVCALSAAYPGLVESSANLSETLVRPGDIHCHIYQRSSVPAATEAMRRDYAALALRCGGTLQVLSTSPAWPLNEESRLLPLCTAAYRDLTGAEMAVGPIHAGLECGCWAEKNPALDMISIGPEATDIHSPDEVLQLESVAVLGRLVTRLLEDIAHL